MSNTNTSSPVHQAFPSTFHNRWGEPEKGMTLRDYFAAKAMQGMLASHNMPNAFDAQPVADKSYVIADAMLAARSNT